MFADFKDLFTCADFRLFFQSVLEREINERREAEDVPEENENNHILLVEDLPGIVYKGYRDGSVEFFDVKMESFPSQL